MNKPKLLTGLLPAVLMLALVVAALPAMAGSPMSSRAEIAWETPQPALLAAIEGKDKFRDNELLVKFAPELSKKERDALLASYNAKVKREYRDLDVFLIKVKEGSAIEVLTGLIQEPGVLWAELNFVVGPALGASDPDYNDPAKVYAPQKIGAEAAWDRTTGSDAVVVAVVDSGISFAHPEFDGRIVPGYDFVYDTTNPQDDNGHGTHVAGIIAAAMNNGIGSTGIAPNVKIMPIKVLDASAIGTWADIAAGIVYAADQGARIVNLSLGGPIPSQTLAAAIQNVAGRGVLVVAAAGNLRSSEPFYPAYYAETLAVSATDRNDLLWADSNFGPAVDIAAPGAGIYSTYWTSSNPAAFASLNGTSMATPHVSAVAALILSLRPELSMADIRALIEAIIQGHADDLGPTGWDASYGWGRLNAGAAVAAAAVWTPPTPTPTPTPYARRVNAGGSAFVDGQGQTWAADQPYTAGGWGYTAGSAKTRTTAISGTADDALYQAYRSDPVEYRFTVPAGAYRVTLRFAELEVSKANDRLMKITLEGTVVENALDIFKLAGKAAALDRTYTVDVNDGVLNIAFASAGSRNKPVVSALEVTSIGAQPPVPTPTPDGGGFSPTATPTSQPTTQPTVTPTPTPAGYTQRVNAGGVDYVDSNLWGWAADRAFVAGSWGYTGGSARSATTAVAGTTEDLLYQKYRENPGEYRFTVPNGNYQVTLLFAEFAVSSATDRLMRITLEGTVVEDALSIYGLVGKATALERTYTVRVNDGVLNIGFARNGGKKDPAVSAIEVRLVK